MPNLPSLLLKSLNGFDGFDEQAFTEAHREEHKITSLRLNPLKPANLDFTLGSPVPWASDAYYLTERPSFTHDPLFQAGCYYVQEAGSMFIDYLLRGVIDKQRSMKVLDLCAAPGGKSTLLSSLLSPDSLLVSNELIKSRAAVLVHNMSKWGSHHGVVTNNEAAVFAKLPNYFDVLVVDAPCSGSGLFRKQPEAINEWREESVTSCSIRQKNILEEVLPALKPGGYLVYSTCSYSEEENEAVVRWLLQQHELEMVPVPVSGDWGIVQNDLGYRFYPHRTQSEGFFCALLRKGNSSEAPEQKPFRKNNVVSLSKTELDLFKKYVDVEGTFAIKIGQYYHLVNAAVNEILQATQARLYFKKAGVCMGEVKGKDFVPNQELAWYPWLNADIAVADLDRENAIKFLKKEPFEVSQKSQGLVMLRYAGQGLGWAKILSNRVNNYLPAEYRILK